MSQCMERDERLRELVGTDLPPDELERVARVDALLRIIAARELERRGFSSVTPGPVTARDESPHTPGRSREYERSGLGSQAHSTASCPTCGGHSYRINERHATAPPKTRKGRTDDRAHLARRRSLRRP